MINEVVDGIVGLGENHRLFFTSLPYEDRLFSSSSSPPFFDPSISRAGHRVPKSFVFFYCVCVLFLNDQSEIRTENREMAEG